MSKGSAADTAGTAVKGYFDPSGYIASTAVRVFSGKDRTKPPSRRQREQLIAAGYTVGLQRIGRGAGVEVFTSPQGRILGPDSARIAAKRLPTPPIAPQPQLPTGSDIFEELLKRPARTPSTPPLDPDFERLLKRGPQTDFERLLDRPFRPAQPVPEAKPPPKVGRVLGRVLGRVGGVIGGILYPSETASDDVLYPPGTAIPLPQPDRPRGPPRRPVITREPKDRPARPGPFPETVADRLPQPRAPADAAPLPFPVVLPGREPQPSTSKSPRPATAPQPTVSPVGLPSPAPFAFPLPLPRVSVRPRPIVSPLTAGVPGTELTRLTSPRPSPLTLTQTAPVGSPPSDRCSCPPKQKRKPSKPRNVCYSGSYRERARGIDKQPRRRISCL